MIRAVTGLVAGLCVMLAYAPPSDACGIKLTVKSPKVKKQARRSPNPSRILLLGDPPRRLSRDLSRAGHDVEVADSAGSADRQDYELVMADSDKVDGAREQWPEAVVVSRSGNTTQNVARVERSLQRTPTATSRRRIAGRSGDRGRNPVASGPDRADDEDEGGSRRLRASGSGSAGPPAPAENDEPAPAEDDEPATATGGDDEGSTNRGRARRGGGVGDDEPASDDGAGDEPLVASRDTPRDNPDRKARDHGREKPEASEPAAATFTGEIFFSTNSTRLSRRSRRSLRQNAAWLEQNAGVSITLEGHTDKAGDADYNLALSRKRAETARDYLVSQGVDRGRIEVTAIGEDQPAYGDGWDGKNRRVVIAK